MKRFTAASSAVAAATLVSAAALMGASGALASEPLRLDDGQMDAVTAGTESSSVQSSTAHMFQSNTTIGNDGMARTVWERTIIENGRKQVERGVTEEPFDTNRYRPHVHRPDIPDFHVDIDVIRRDVEARVAELRERAAAFRN